MYIIFWDVRMIEGRRTTFSPGTNFFRYSVYFIFSELCLGRQPLYTITLCAILFYVQNLLSNKNIQYYLVLLYVLDHL